MQKNSIYSILYIEDNDNFGQGVTKMKRTEKRENRRKKAMYFVVFVIIFSLFFIRTSHRYSQKFVSGVVEAGNLSDSILLLSEKGMINMALQNEKQLREKEEVLDEEVKNIETNIKEDEKIAYLTFDDGPSKNITPQILDVLKEYDVKATFFVIGNLAKEYPEIVKRMNEEGHVIGNHTYSHRYKYIYKNTTNFIGELKTTEKVLKNILGDEFETKIVRLPGGSFGSKRVPFKKAVMNNGYSSYDWNSLNGDAEGHNISKGRLVERLKSTSKGKDELIILMHDMSTKKTTAEALPEIIDYLQQQGYKFEILK